jgi:hypothetical protein
VRDQYAGLMVDEALARRGADLLGGLLADLRRSAEMSGLAKGFFKIMSTRQLFRLGKLDVAVGVTESRWVVMSDFSKIILSFKAIESAEPGWGNGTISLFIDPQDASIHSVVSLRDRPVAILTRQDANQEELSQLGDILLGQVSFIGMAMKVSELFLKSFAVWRDSGGNSAETYYDTNAIIGVSPSHGAECVGRLEANGIFDIINDKEVLDSLGIRCRELLDAYILLSQCTSHGLNTNEVDIELAKAGYDPKVVRSAWRSIKSRSGVPLVHEVDGEEVAFY